ncbi:hypothetical protein GB931_01135 [Modestobacter sp. I12A-02628]|uniref:Ester cyclase n=1 Tax=Goekera deserti TaxID=2497753 RepID=A0A7K3WGF6_9ACTN|nr:hypothetical protein [Goekera deserti]NDI47140.1 hypothetical protein [Goekera deserti]NEL55462.1 ester cyclase [Goekera deserti]
MPPDAGRAQVERVLGLWTAPVPADDALAEAAFAACWWDPVSINGEPLGTGDVVARARALQQALQWPTIRVLSVIGDGPRTAVAYRLRGRQVGTLETSVGPVAPTGGVVELRTVQIWTVARGRVREVWSAADELGALYAVDGVRVPSQPPLVVPADHRPWEHAESEGLHS